MLKKITLFFCLLLCSGRCWAQTVFEYDVAGNRIKRTGIIVADLTPTIDVYSGTILGIGASASMAIYIENIRPTTTTGPVTIRITKPLASSGLTLSIPSTVDWSVSENSLSFDLTLQGQIPGLDFKIFEATVTRTGGSAGSYNFTPVILNGSGGELNFTNNRVSVVINKS